MQFALWGSLGLGYLGWATWSATNAAPGNAKAFFMPMAAGLVGALSAVLVIARGGKQVVDPTDVPDVPGTFRDVCLLTAVFFASWLVMPIFGLVLASLVLFVVLALVYRDQTPRAVVFGVILLFVMLVVGAERLLQMPLLRSPYLNLPF